MAYINTTETIKRNSLNEISDEEILRQINSMGEQVKNEPRVPIYLPENPDKEHQEPKEVGINGYNFLIPRGRTVMVPYCVYTELQMKRLVQ